MLSEKEIIERYYEDILKYCLTKMKREDAEVITQGVFCDYLEKNKIEEIRNPRSYLYSVARSKIGAFYRKRTVIRSYEVSDGKIYDLINNNHDMDNDDGLIEDEYDNTCDYSQINVKDSDIEYDCVYEYGTESNTEINKRRYNKKEEVSFDSETLSLKKKIIESLSDEDKKLYIYIYEKKLKHRQIADLENIKLNAVKKRAERLSKKIISAVHDIFTKK